MHVPVLQYFGGKFKLANWIISQLPKHKVYVEPFGGAASVLMRKPRSRKEFLGDLQNEIVNVFRVLRDKEKSVELRRLIELTPYSNAEAQLCKEFSSDDIESARRTIVLSFLASSGIRPDRQNVSLRMSRRFPYNHAKEWTRYPAHIEEFTRRLKGVHIVSGDAITLMKRTDSPDTLFYVDPPYVHTSRHGDKQYEYEMNAVDHVALSEFLRNVSAKVVLSGYESTLYDQLYVDWRKIYRDVSQGGYQKGPSKREVLWFNHHCEKENCTQTSMF